MGMFSSTLSRRSTIAQKVPPVIIKASSWTKAKEKSPLQILVSHNSQESRQNQYELKTEKTLEIEAANQVETLQTNLTRQTTIEGTNLSPRVLYETELARNPSEEPLPLQLDLPPSSS